MNKEEIIKYIQEEIENETDTFHWFDNTPNNKTRKDIEKSIQAHQGLLDLYNKEKEKNTFGVVSKDKINNIIKKLDNLEIRNHNLTAESFAKNILKDLLEENV